MAESQVSIDSNSCSQVAARLVQKVAHRMCALALLVVVVGLQYNL